ncbi:MAG: hypothetical protein WDO15_17375 [Bacteroidota bacterium]
MVHASIHGIKAKYHHDGIDFAVFVVRRSLRQVEGTVILVKQSDVPAGYGTYIEIDHGYAT